MNKNLIVEFLMGKIDYSKEDQQIIDGIEDAKLEMEVASCMFESVNDPRLIEVAIYSQEAAKKRYEYLLSLAKERQITRAITTFY
ncbi:YaaL family protein [Clostridium gasigenes]|uniref:YaaL family protein n=1 Tax=Clostridium gasigenes TaxID=94869 RepID=UPI001C0DB7C7|nr:YaaL family protein [Clostridium gasigenes]MBU3137814.1 YaaL family protein [Clostridium gasigenes]